MSFESYLLAAAEAYEHAPESMIITEAGLSSPGPRIVLVNEACERMTGYGRDELVGQTPRILQGPQTDPAVLDRLRDSLAATRRFLGSVTNYRKNGEPYLVHWTISALTDDDDVVCHWLSLQTDVTDLTTSDSGRAGESAAAVAAASVLYVEDDEPSADLMRMIANRVPEVALIRARSGEQGLALARTAKPGLILLDIDLPGMTGHETLGLLRRDSLTQAIPVIAITAGVMPKDLERLAESGFDGYVTKPFRIDEILDMLRGLASTLD